MAYIQQQDGTIIINGFEQGIADSPYAGISDMRNINIISVPQEASVGFSTANVSGTTITGTMTTSSASGDTITTAALLDTRQCIRFATVTDATKGIAIDTNYWVEAQGGTEWKLYNSLHLSSVINITGDGLQGTFTTVNVSFFNSTALSAGDGVVDNNNKYWIIDGTGKVWTTSYLTTNNNYWVYTGNSGGSGTWGNPSIGFYEASDGTGYIFAFRNNYIDYTPCLTASISWTYGWKTLKTASGVANSHKTLTAPDNRFYYCDGNWIGRFYQTSSTTPFDPSNSATYTYDPVPLLPYTERAQCLTYLGTNLLVGGVKNIIYPWDRSSTVPEYQILIAENGIYNMITINTNAYILAGNRGRIYITNGSQAMLYKKVPDHISGTVEPYFTWGGLASTKNQIYFSVYATTNAGTALDDYGGVWAIDTDTKAMRLVNKLSYNSYSGFAPVILPQLPFQIVGNPAGTGLYIGWNNGSAFTGTNWGIDETISTPYTGGESYIDSDLIPVGTVLKPTTNGSVEFKLSRPLVSGESVKVQYRQIFNESDTGFTDIQTSGGTTTFNTAGIYSGVYQDVNFQNSQWIQFRVVLTSTASSPSYVRLTELRVK